MVLRPTEQQKNKQTKKPLLISTGWVWFNIHSLEPKIRLVRSPDV